MLKVVASHSGGLEYACFMWLGVNGLRGNWAEVSGPLSALIWQKNPQRVEMNLSV